MGGTDQERAEAVARRANDLRGQAAAANETLDRIERDRRERIARRAGVALA